MKNKEEKLKAAVLLAAQRDGQELMDADNAEPCEDASPEARARLFATIENKKKPSKERHWYTPTAKKVAIAVASVIILLVMIPSTTEAGRKWITELIGKVFPSFTEYSLSDYEKVPDPTVNDYTISYIPIGFQLISENHDETGTTLLFCDDYDHFIRLSIIGPNGVMQIDTENAEITKTIFIGEEVGALTLCDGITSIVWSVDEAIILVGGNIEEDELLRIANSIKK